MPFKQQCLKGFFMPVTVVSIFTGNDQWNYFLPLFIEKYFLLWK